MISNGKLSFDPKIFLSEVNGGRAISHYRKDQIVYRQGEAADSVFYVQRARSKRPSSPSRGRKPWSELSEPTISLAKGVWPDSHCVSQLSPQ